MFKRILSALVIPAIAVLGTVAPANAKRVKPPVLIPPVTIVRPDGTGNTYEGVCHYAWAIFQNAGGYPELRIDDLNGHCAGAGGGVSVMNLPGCFNQYPLVWQPMNPPDIGPTTKLWIAVNFYHCAVSDVVIWIKDQNGVAAYVVLT